jgi:hypothetical protein
MLVIAPALRILQHPRQYLNRPGAYLLYRGLESSPFFPFDCEGVAGGVNPPSLPFQPGEHGSAPFIGIAPQRGEQPNRIHLTRWNHLRDRLSQTVPSRRSVQCGACRHAGTCSHLSV